MNRRLAALLAVLALGLVGAGCGGGDDDEGEPAGAATTEQPAGGGETGAGEPAESGVTEIAMKDIEFVPHDVTVAPGTKLLWTNDDAVAHTVTKESGPGEEFDSGNVGPGDTYELSVQETGKIEYVCTIHPGQDGTITVE